MKIKIIKLKVSKKGFTLIELVTVLAIIAILSSALIPKISNYITEAKKVAILNEAKTVVAAYESSKIRISSDETNTHIKDLITKKFLASDSIKKISPDFSVAQCKHLMDTENYTFTINSGYATPPQKINNAASTSY